MYSKKFQRIPIDSKKIPKFSEKFKKFPINSKKFREHGKDEPDAKKTKLDEVHDEEYQKKLFTAAREYTTKKYKQDLMDNIHRWNWKVRKGEKEGRIKANDIKGNFDILKIPENSEKSRKFPNFPNSEKIPNNSKKKFKKI